MAIDYDDPAVIQDAKDKLAEMYSRADRQGRILHTPGTHERPSILGVVGVVIIIGRTGANALGKVNSVLINKLLKLSWI